MTKDYDLVIVGVGPAGLSAGIYGGRFGLRTLVVGETLGGMASEASVVENYPGIESASGMEIAEKMAKQCESSGAEILLGEKVETLDLKGERKKATTFDKTFEADAMIIATGSYHRKLGVPGEEEFRGRGVSYCAVCDGAFFKGRKVAVVGGGDTAATEALYLTELAGKVFLIHRRSELRAETARKQRIAESGVEFLWNKVVKEVHGDNVVKGVTLRDTVSGDESELEIDGLFIAIGEAPQSEFAKDAGVAVDEAGYIIVNRDQETSIKGVYAAGDVTGGVRQIGAAVGGGITAAINAYLYITGGWYGKKKEGAGSP